MTMLEFGLNINREMVGLQKTTETHTVPTTENADAEEHSTMFPPSGVHVSGVPRSTSGFREWHHIEPET